MRTKIYIISISIILTILTACTSNSSLTTEAVTLQLSWFHEYPFAPFYIASENGYFTEQHLDVTLLEGGFVESGVISPVNEVLNGNADFGIAQSLRIIQARSEGQPLIAIATLLQRNPFALISLADSDILTPQDLVGKTIMVADGTTQEQVFRFLSDQGIAIESVNLVPRVTFGVEPLVDGDVDILGGWIINEAIMVEEAGFNANTMLLSDYGIDDYSSVIFTTEDILRNRPDLVERFLSAYLSGLRDVLGNSEASIHSVLAYNSDLNTQGQQERLDAMLPLIYPIGSQLGFMNLGSWEQTQDRLLSQGIMSEPIDLNTVFTNEFLTAIYETE